MWSEFEHAYNHVAVMYVTHYATETLRNIDDMIQY